MAQQSHHSTFLEHYMAYLSSPGVALIAIVAFLLLALFFVHNTGSQHRRSAALDYPGCARFGLYGRSNLDKRRVNHAEESNEPRVQAIFAYPIKSCRGVELQTTEITSTGLKYDRLFSFAHWVQRRDDKGRVIEGEYHWKFLTQREKPQLSQVTTELWIPDPRLRSELLPEDVEVTEQSGRDALNDWEANGGCLVVRFPFGSEGSTETVTFKLPLKPTSERAAAKGYTYAPMKIWKDDPLAINVSSEIDAITLEKLKSFLGVDRSFALFRIDDNDNLRTVTRCLPKDRLEEKFQVGFADAFPVSLLSIASVRAIDDFLPSTSQIKSSLSPRRFRANIFISGIPAFAEDQWKRIILGRAGNPGEVASDSEFHVACRTARCRLPNVDPETGLRDREEPFMTLERKRQVDDGAKPHAVLGLSMIPLFERGWLRVGEKVEVLETGEHVYEKMYT
ncbi:unnamed protein product [Zymoseptoria tritici ST99CH_1A5]|uniref:MOSC domain-containing protein n=4 Tax=Zymoseptoria tritici TaxID=1047171 RepID=A0A1X7RSK5_ZYMT9|nr:unnamed protein product [Zymoseptoria tritici ST99CH_3D7]SMR51196.1 unnamed protein product [Zymoseptoria tritici ST99CH_1E4]SMY23890.1 unnamed protein product [Zymoseptoria tritici ST99CH_1A5]